jgi:serine/threonine protein phosphatase 1
VPVLFGVNNKKNKMFKRYEKNELGRDFVVGDIHGCFTLLEKHLKALGFNEQTDRLFSVGDLVDRGAESPRVLEFLAKPWFFAVRGNHDQMAIDYTKGQCNINLYKSNGGMWFINLPLEDREKIAKEFGKLPVAMEVETERGLVGIVHADCPYPNWDEIRNMVNIPFVADQCMWLRDRQTNGDDRGVAGVWCMVVGHTPVLAPRKLGNVINIDTGACFRGTMTVLEMTKLYY